MGTEIGIQYEYHCFITKIMKEVIKLKASNSVNRDDYVIMLPQQERLYQRYIEFEFGTISVNSNLSEIFNTIYSPHDVKLNNGGYDIVGDIMVIYEPNLFNASVICTTDKFIKKDKEKYEKGIYNKLYRCENLMSNIEYYPFYNATLVTSSNSYFSIAPEKDVVQLSSKKLLKMAMSKVFDKNGYYALHCSCVKKGSDSYLFISGGRAGKTTIYMNLLLDGYEAVNDDIVYLTLEDKRILVKGIYTYPSIREESLKFIPKLKKDSLKDCYRGFENEYYINVYNCDDFDNNKKSIELKAVFIPEIGHKETKIYRVDPKRYYKRILRAFMAHRKIDNVDESFASIFFALTKMYPFYKIELATDMQEFIEVFNKATNDI